jgi:hypothetical protein
VSVAPDGAGVVGAAGVGGAGGTEAVALGVLEASTGGDEVGIAPSDGGT